MYALIIIAALAASLAALIHLARTDPKRRRVFGLPEYQRKRRSRLLLAVLIVPGITLLATGDAAGFTIWLGALTVTGWGVAALDPQRSAAVGTRILGTGSNAWDRAVACFNTLRNHYRTLRDTLERIKALERRVAELEAEIARWGGDGFLNDGRAATTPTRDSVNGVSTN